MCIDPKDQIEAILRSHFQIPSFERFILKSEELKWFVATIDSKNGFCHIKLTERSSYLCTFNTCNDRSKVTILSNMVFALKLMF